MTLGFKIGVVYHRRSEVHPILGGNQQSGISYAAGGAAIFFVTGQAGESAGYEDGWREDGIFEYCGEGQVGPQTFTAGNLEILNHSKNGKQLLMFTNVAKGRIRFDGEVICEGYEWREIRDRNNDMRPGIIFFLRPIDAVVEAVNSDPTLAAADIGELRRRAYDAISVPADYAQRQTRTVYQRSKDIRDYVLARAKGQCEGGRHPANFTRADGSPYLEPHHLRRVSDGGPDDPRFVIALCETCHRKCHHAGNGAQLNRAMLDLMQKIEPTV